MFRFINKTCERRQLNPIECGAVSLGIILQYFGLFVSNKELSKRAKISRNGSDMSSLIDAAKFYGLAGKAKRVIANDVKKIKQLSILFFDNSHFVVLEGYFLGRFYINDPALGRYCLDEKQFRARFSRVLITFDKLDNFKKNSVPKNKINNKWWVVLGLLSAIICSFIASSIKLLILSPWPFLLSFTLLILLCYACWQNFSRLVYINNREYFNSLVHGIMRAPDNFFEDFPFDTYTHQLKYSYYYSLKEIFYSARKYFIFSFLSLLVIMSLIVKENMVYVLVIYFLFLFAVILCVYKKQSLALRKTVISELLCNNESPLMLGENNYILQVCNLSFSYDDKNIFSDISFNLNKNTVYALVASPMSGVSTLMNLFAHAVVPQSGYVAYYKKDIPLSFINEDAGVFEGSLKEVLSLFDESIADTNLVEALKLSQGTSIYYNRPLGLLTPIFKDGVNLSYGEKKCLLLAQALVHKAELFLLDDFFSHVNHKKAQAILDNLKHYEGTIIFNSYKEDLLKKADQVIFIKDSKTITLTDHKQLLKDPFYKNLLLMGE